MRLTKNTPETLRLEMPSHLKTHLAHFIISWKVLFILIYLQASEMGIFLSLGDSSVHTDPAVGSERYPHYLKVPI